MSYPVRYVLLPFLVSLLVSAVGTWLVRTVAHRTGILDKPGEHKQHERPTPTLGGVAVFLGFLAGVLLSGRLSVSIIVFLVTSGAIVLIGTLDDIYGVSAKIKLGMLAGATAVLWQAGVHLHMFGLEGPGAYVLTFLWVGLISSAFNGVDNADGSAAGLAAIAGIWGFFISWYTWQHDLAVVTLVLAGASLGFLLFNFPAPRATIFLGDSGSLFLGYSIASITVLGSWSSVGWKAAVVAPMLVLVPLFDFLFILIVRGLEGRYHKWDDPIRMCARDHTFHRLRHAGWGGKSAVLIMYAAGLAAGGVAYIWVREPAMLSLYLAAALTAGVVALGALLNRIRLPSDAYPVHE